jgi:hypothetical protein
VTRPCSLNHGLVYFGLSKDIGHVEKSVDQVRQETTPTKQTIQGLQLSALSNNPGKTADVRVPLLNGQQKKNPALAPGSLLRPRDSAQSCICSIAHLASVGDAEHLFSLQQLK